MEKPLDIERLFFMDSFTIATNPDSIGLVIRRIKASLQH